MKTFSSLIIGLLLPAFLLAGDGIKAVVRIPSHGASGVIIAPALVLTVEHAFPTLADKAKPVLVDALQEDVPLIGIKARLLGTDRERDLALVELPIKLKYVAPVARDNHLFDQGLLSVGHDLMKNELTKVPGVKVLHEESGYYWTKEIPWFGRSGGPLLDSAGDTVGITHGFTTPGGDKVTDASRGLFITLQNIQSTLEEAKQMKDIK